MAVCKHIGDYTGVRLKVQCGPATQRMATKATYQCEIHNRCIPAWVGPWRPEQGEEARIYKICRRCAEYEP